jgi:hypothetical protein
LATLAGPITINEGQSVSLNATGSSDPDGDVLSYTWDLNGDGVYGDFSGPTPTPTWGQLRSVGLVSGQTYNVGVRVSDNFGGIATATTTLTIIALPPTASAGGPYAIAEGQSLTLAATASDPGGGPLSLSWDINGDGVYGDATGAAPTLTWNQLRALGINNGPALLNVALRVVDTLDLTSTLAFTTVAISNTPPSASITGPAVALRGQALSYTLTATDVSSTDQAAGFTFTIDWNGDGSDVEVVSGPSGMTVSHTFNELGPRTIKLTATDKDGGVSATSTSNVTVSAVQLVNNSGVVDLVWSGSAGDDHVQFVQLDNTTIRVTSTLDNGLAKNFVETFSGVTGRVVANGGEGHDTLDASLLSTRVAALDGGAGNNTLYGGGANDTLIGGANFSSQTNGPEGQQGNNIVVGGAGDDTIYGNAINGAEGLGGDNLLLGGAGNDTLYGNWANGGEGGGRNVLVGGANTDTLYDYRVADGGDGRGSILIADETTLGLPELGAVLSEWASTRPYSTRVDNLLGVGTGDRANGNVFLRPGVTVTPDTAADRLWGSTAGTGYNWYWQTLAYLELYRVKPREIRTMV